jgi:hypothetical protein
MSKELILEIKAITDKARKDIQRLEQGINKTRKESDKMRISSENMERSLGQLRNKILLVTFAFGGMVAGIKRSVTEATKVQTLTRSFVNLGAQVGITEKSLQKLRDATNGTVTDTELLIQANNALLLGIVQNDDQLANLFDSAQRLAQAVGQDAVFGIESLTTGIGRQSRLMLDNLGIIVDTNKAYEKYAEANDTTVKALTDFERKQAFISATMDSINEKLERAGEEVIDFNQQMAKLPVSFTNLQVAIGTHLAPGFAAASESISDVVNQMATFILTLESNTLKNIKELAENMGILTGAILAMRTAMIIFSQAALVFALRFAAIAVAIESISLVRRNIEVFTAALKEMRLELAEITAGFREGSSNLLAKLGLDGVQIGMSKQEMENLRAEIIALRQSATEGGVTTRGVLQDLLFGDESQMTPEEIQAETERIAEIINKIFEDRKSDGQELKNQNNELKQMVSLHERAAGKLGQSIKNNENIGEAILKIIANLALEIASLKIKLSFEKKITEEKEKQAKIQVATTAGTASSIVSFLGGLFQTGGSYVNKFPTGGSFNVNKRTVLPTNPPAIVGDNASGMERIDVTPLPSPTKSTDKNITINIMAPLVDETVVDTIIPAIRRAEKLNL